MKDFMTWKIIGLAVTFIIGPLTYLVVKHIKQFWIWLDRQPRIAQQAFVMVIAFALTAIAQLLGLTLPGECTLIGDGIITQECRSAVADPVWVKGVMSAFIAYFMHALKKSDPDDDLARRGR